jgi:type IV pilus assembly protein PilB
MDNYSSAGGTLYRVLINENLLTQDAVAEFPQDNTGFFEHLLDSGVLPFYTLAELLARVYGIDYRELGICEPAQDALALLGYDIAVKYSILPIECDDISISLAMVNPFNLSAIDDVQALTGRHPKPYLANAGEVVFFINKYYGSAQLDTITSQYVVDESLRNRDYALDPAQIADIQNAPAVRLLDSLLLSAVLYGASDIHIEPYERSSRARFRVDGRLREFREVPSALQPNIIGRLKAMCRINMSDTRLPQDGHFSYEYQKKRIDFRVSTMPSDRKSVV